MIDLIDGVIYLSIDLSVSFQDELDNEAESDEVLDCLIEHKNHADMKAKCAIGIEHHQLVCIVLYCIVLIGAFISIFSNQLKALQG